MQLSFAFMVVGVAWAIAWARAQRIRAERHFDLEVVKEHFGHGKSEEAIAYVEWVR